MDGWLGGKWKLDKRARGQEGKRARGQEGKRHSGHLDTHEDRYHLLNETLVLNGPGGHRKRERKVFGGEEKNTFPH